MSEEITVPMLRDRLHNYSAVAYTQVSGLLLSGIFALGAVALLDILRTADHRVLRLSFWSMITAGEVVAAMNQMQRPALMRRSGVEEVPALVFRGIVALLTYAAIAPQSGGVDGWRYTYGLGILFVLANWLLNRSLSRALALQTVSPELAKLMEPLLKAQMRLTDQLPAFIAVLTPLLALTALSPREWLFVEWVALAYNVVAGSLIIAIGVSVQRTWTTFESAVLSPSQQAASFPTS